jgi:hypothetical protein
MADRRDEVVLQAIQLLQALVGGAQLRGRGLQLVRLLLEPAAVFDHLRGLVEDAHDFVDAERLFFRDGRDHDARRGGADGAGQQPLGMAHEFTIDGECGEIDATARGIVLERFIGANAPEEPRHQVRKVGQLGGAAPEPSGLGLLKGIDEQRGLGAFERGLVGQQRNADEGADIHQHGPEQAVGDGVEAGEAEEGVGLQERNAERPLIDELERQPAGAGERGQQKRVGPQEEAAADGDEGRRRAGAPPEQAEQDGRKELGDGGEGDESDGDERIAFADQPHVEIAEQQQEWDRHPPNLEQERRQLGPIGEAEPAPAQQQWHHQIVRHHRAKGHGLHDDHAGAGREAADEDEQRQRILLGRQRQSQHDGIGVDSRRAVRRPASAIGSTKMLIRKR